MIADGKPAIETLTELVRIVEAQDRGLRGGILVLGPDGAQFNRSIGPSLPDHYHSRLSTEPILPPYRGSCAEAAHLNSVMESADLATETRWSQEWREMVLACGIKSVRSSPVRGLDGRVLASLAVYHDSATLPNLAQQQAIDMVRQLSAIALERQAALGALNAAKAELAGELNAALQLQDISGQLIGEDNIDGLYRRLLDAAIMLMGSDAASMQLLDRESNTLHLLASRGLHERSETFWNCVRLDSESSCGEAFAVSQRVIVADVETCAFMAGTADLEAYRWSGVRAVQSTPLMSRGGHLIGMISTHWKTPHQLSERDLVRFDVLARQACDLIERALDRVVLQHSEARLAAALKEAKAAADGFRFLAESMPQKIFTADASGNVDYINAQWLDFSGLSFDEIKVGGWLQFVHPDDVRDNIRVWKHSIATGEPFEFIHRFKRADGRYRWHLSRARPMRDKAGQISMWIGSNTDIHDERVAAEELRATQQQQILLIGELAHRTKNLFAIVGGLVTMCARFAQTPGELARTLRSRLQALASAHALVRPAPGPDGEIAADDGLTLAALLDRVLCPYDMSSDADGRRRIVCDGPAVALGESATTVIALLVHELATNAVKYGAFANDRGSVDVNWSVTDGMLSLRWRERDGPALTEPPQHEGFGSLLARQTVTSQIGGTLTRTWDRDGLTLVLEAPLARLI